MAKFAVILAAAGKSQRFGDQFYKKPFVPLANRPVWMYSAERFVNRDDVSQVILAVAPEDREMFDEKFGGNAAILGIRVVTGGEERSDTVAKALEQVDLAVEYVCIHDAARPCLADEWINRVFAAAEKSGAAILAIPVAATLKRVESDAIVETVDRRGLWEAQTPQVFRRDVLAKAYAQRGDAPSTDDAQLVERTGHPVAIVQGSPINLKITTREDLRLAEQALKAVPKPKLAGFDNPFAGDDLWR